MTLKGFKYGGEILEVSFALDTGNSALDLENLGEIGVIEDSGTFSYISVRLLKPF